MFAHIFLGRLSEPGDTAAFALLQDAKHRSTLFLTLPGLGLTVASGLALAALRPELARSRWLWLKALLAIAIVANGALVLSPVGEAIAALAQAHAGAEALAPLLRRETMFGALNLVMVLAVVVLAVARPRLGRRTHISR